VTDRCEPPPELREFGVWHWLEYREPFYTLARWDYDGWWMPEDQNVCQPEGMNEHWRYIAPVASPEEVAALRAEVERLRMALALISLGTQRTDSPAHVLAREAGKIAHAALEEPK
jgi:hypothetical protein